MSKEDRALALKVCQEIIDSFKNSLFDKAAKKGGIFSNLDTSQAEGGQDKDTIEDFDNDQDLDVDDAANFDMDEFLKQGGLNIDEDDINEDSQGERNSEELKKEPEYNTEANDRMCGYLTKSSIKLGSG